MNPLSALFGAGVALRNLFYDAQVFTQHRLAKPVISVGNLSAGGAGKTPFVLLLGELLKARKIAFDVLSRGYGRQDALVKIVDAKGTSTEYGDEPLLLARGLEVPVIVGADRAAAGRHAESAFAGMRPAHGDWVHLLDDGFQHRRLWRDFDIVLLSRPDLHDRLLPLGRLRESPSSLRRADAIVFTDAATADELPLSLRHKTLWRVQRTVSLPAAVPARVVAFCGVARPRQFFDDLEKQGIRPAATRVFRDHHRYRAVDAERLLSLRSRASAGAFITTSKDIINLEARNLLSALQPVIELSLRMSFIAPTGPEVIESLMKTLKERRSSLAPGP